MWVIYFFYKLGNFKIKFSLRNQDTLRSLATSFKYASFKEYLQIKLLIDSVGQNTIIGLCTGKGLSIFYVMFNSFSNVNLFTINTSFSMCANINFNFFVPENRVKKCVEVEKKEAWYLKISLIKSYTCLNEIIYYYWLSKTVPIKNSVILESIIFFN